MGTLSGFFTIINSRLTCAEAQLGVAMDSIINQNLPN